jgi:hypothetical protein
MITPKELKALAKAMHQAGVVSLKTPEVELLVQPMAPKVRRKKPAVYDEPIQPLEAGFKGYTEEEILAWSAPTIG